MITLEPSDRLAKPVVTTLSLAVRPLANDRIMLVLLRHRHGLGRDDVVLADDVAERADRSALHRRRRHHQRLRQGLDLEADIDELARPELVVGVGEFGLELERAGGLVDLVVDAGELAGVDYGDAVIAEHVDRERPLAAAALTRMICCCGRLNHTAIGCNCVMTTRPVVSAAWMMLPWST